MLIDTHCHLHDREFFTKEQAEKMLARAAAANVAQIICAATSLDDSKAAVDFAATHPGVFAAIGIHPESASEERSEKEPFAVSPELPPQLVAIGEVGLDYHYEPYDRSAQIRLFEQMLQLAKGNNLPVIFHVREAFADFFPIIANFPKTKGVVHSFTDNKKTLHKILETTDFYVGVNGLATYSTLPTPPLERILLETDAPFLTPAPNRGKINEPAYVPDIAKFLSTKLGVSEQEIAETTTKNARQLFNLPDTVLRPTPSG